MFLAPVCTTSSSDLTVSLIVSSRDMDAVWLRSRNSRTVLLERPIAFAFLFGFLLDSATLRHTLDKLTMLNRYLTAPSGTVVVSCHLDRIPQSMY
jgi:hypothetical protein